MRIKAAIRNLFTANWRQKLTLLSSGFIVYVILLTGIFSYFHSEDVATNRLDAKSGSVTVHEPLWDKEGQKMAQASEPGMKIPKNPFGTNNGQVDEYIRLKMTVSLDGFDCTGKTDEYNNTFNDNTGDESEHLADSVADANEIAKRRQRRLNSILNAIKVGEGATVTALFEFEWTNPDSDISAWTGIANKNDKFVMEEQSIPNDNTVRVFYFYYTGGDTEQNMKVVRPGNSTAELFDFLEIPIYKKDYLGVFDQGYTITIEAQAVPTAACTEGTKVSDVEGKFVP